MKRLSRSWLRWRATRYRTLAADGVPCAWQIATGEAHVRCGIARALGHAAATDARLMCAKDGSGGVKFYLIGPIDGLDEGALDRAADKIGLKFAIT